MIHFEITQAPDHNVLNQFQFFKNEVYLGKGSHDLSIMDHQLRQLHLLLEIPENDLLIHPLKDVEYFLLNGKRSCSIRRANVGDEITIGNTVFKILGFQRTDWPSKKEILDTKLNGLIQEGSSRLSLIEEITKKMS